MFKHYQRVDITPNVHTIFGSLLHGRRIVMERRGISNTREFGAPDGSFYLIESPCRGMEVTICEKITKFRPDQVDYRTEIEEFLKEQTGREYLFSQATEAYCFTGLGMPVEAEDLFFTPFRFEESTDTIRHYPTNICLVHFDDGTYDSLSTDMDKASAPYQQAIETAIRHCKMDKSVENIKKRRLAWLAGEYYKQQWAKENPGKELPVTVLKRDMSSPGRMIDAL